MDESTERAIRQVSREIRKQTRVIATIGEAVIGTKIRNVKSERRFALRYLKKAEMGRKK